jgi:hypothetical protein
MTADFSIDALDRINGISERLADVLPGAVPALERLIRSPHDRELVREAIRTTANTVIIVGWARIVEGDILVDLERVADQYEREMDWFHAGETIRRLAGGDLRAHFLRLDTENGEPE